MYQIRTSCQRCRTWLLASALLSLTKVVQGFWKARNRAICIEFSDEVFAAHRTDRSHLEVQVRGKVFISGSAATLGRPLKACIPTILKRKVLDDFQRYFVNTRA